MGEAAAAVAAESAEAPAGAAQGEMDKARELGWNGDMSFLDARATLRRRRRRAARRRRSCHRRACIASRRATLEVESLSLEQESSLSVTLSACISRGVLAVCASLGAVSGVNPH